MTDEQKAEERYCKTCKKKSKCFHNCDAFIEYLNGLKAGRKEVVIKIKELLCKKDEDYDKAIISPKFLNDYLDDILMLV